MAAACHNYNSVTGLMFPSNIDEDQIQDVSCTYERTRVLVLLFVKISMYMSTWTFHGKADACGFTLGMDRVFPHFSGIAQ